MTDIATNVVAPEVVTTEVAPSVHHASEVEFLRHNSDVDWTSFAPAVYWQNNYRTLRNDDQSIIEVVGDFFSKHFRDAPRTDSRRGLDIGSAGNLYPALALLPWSGSITLTDVSPVNLDWLSAAAAGVDTDDARGRWVWQPFWAEYARYAGYQQLLDPRGLLAARHEVRQQDVLQLEPAAWDLGTMFFVAESITSYQSEFTDAVAGFLRALVPGAPFAAGLMDSSVGYLVGDRSFPAVRSVDAPLVSAVFSQFAEVTVTRIDIPAQDPIQDGYEGMIVVTGTTSR